MLLVVVGKLTFNEQRLINKIKKEIETGPKNVYKKAKPIYIIHNLMNFQTRNQVKYYINKTLLKSASFQIEIMPYVTIKGQESEENENNKEERYIFVENEKTENEVQVYHLIMAREGTEVGNYYNNLTYRFLKEQFNLFTKREPLSIIEEVKNKFVEWSNYLHEENVTSDKIEIEKDNDGKEVRYVFKDS